MQSDRGSRKPAAEHMLQNPIYSGQVFWFEAGRVLRFDIGHSAGGKASPLQVSNSGIRLLLIW
jgi:hypothetical protein